METLAQYRKDVRLAVTHGTRSTYVHQECRCDPCRGAEKAYQAAYRRKNAERLRAYDRRPERDTRLRDDPLKRRVRFRAYDRHARKQKQPCERCGSTNAQLHHDDYERPLDVRWLCPACHGLEHRQ